YGEAVMCAPSLLMRCPRAPKSAKVLAESVLRRYWRSRVDEWLDCEWDQILSKRAALHHSDHSYFTSFSLLWFLRGLDPQAMLLPFVKSRQFTGTQFAAPKRRHFKDLGVVSNRTNSCLFVLTSQSPTDSPVHRSLD